MRVMFGPMSSRALRAAGVAAAMLFGVTSASAQTPQPETQTPQTQQPQPQTQQPQGQQQQQNGQASGVVFTSEAGLVFVPIKPDRTADFEYVMNKYHEALGKTQDATKKQAAQGWKVLKAAEPGPQGSVLYLMLVNPVVPNADYSVAGMLKLLYEVFPQEGQDLYKKLSESFAGGRNLLNLQIVNDFGQPASATPTAPTAPGTTPPTGTSGNPTSPTSPPSTTTPPPQL